MEGESYVGKKKNEVGKWVEIDRGQRQLGPRGCKQRCFRIQTTECSKVTDERRIKLFDSFWKGMSWDEKRMYVRGLVEQNPVLERKVAGESRRKNSFHYFLNTDQGRVRVCKQFFLSTLCLGEASVYKWLAEDDLGKHETPFEPMRGRAKDVERATASSFLDSLPKMPSHYCRSSSTRQYLEPTFASRAELYRCYKERCCSNNDGTVSEKVFFSILDHKNISLFRPRKDQCDTCCGYEARNIEQGVYESHILRKDEARAAKTVDKETAANPGNHLYALTVDMQAVLLCPKLQASALYFKTKLAVHNYTVYNLTTGEALCYVWHEGEGELTGNVFASCLVDYITSMECEEGSEIVIWSDGCNYQNRNALLSNALVHTAEKLKVVITQKFLEKGHTQMECDSVHSTIEKKLKRKPVYVPEMYAQYMREACLQKPYKVKFLDHSFFKNYSVLNTYTSIRPGTRVGDPVVTDIRVIQHSASG